MSVSVSASLYVPESCRVYTPRVLAEAMVKACTRRVNQTWLEPSFGGGVFIQALAAQGIPSDLITGLELQTVDSSVSRLCNSVTGVDGLGWLGAQTSRFDVAIGNPPYVSLSRVSADVRRVARALTLPAGDAPLPGTANLWIAFVYACLDRLADDGALCFVLPASFEHATYAAALRERLPTLFQKVVVYRSRKPLFTGVQEGCVVLLATGFGGSCGGIAKIACSDLQDVVKALGETRTSAVSRSAPNFDWAGRLEQFVRIRLGGVTGDVDYFLFSEKRRREHRLPESAMVPVLSRSRHLAAAVISQAQWRQLLDAGEPVWLFRPSAASLRSKYVRQYLEAGLSGACNVEGYKIRARDPWYETPLPARVHALVSGLVGADPRLSFIGWNQLSATNTLYTVQFANSLRSPDRYAIAASLFTSAVRSQARAKARVYASGLQKLEPRDLLSIWIPRAVPGIDYKLAYRELFMRTVDQAQRMADRLFDL